MFGLGSSSQLGIGIAISLQDRFSGQAAKVNQQLLAMRKNANSAVSGAIKDYRNQSLVIAGGAAIATQGMIGAAKSGAEFQHAINQVYILGGKSIGKTRQQLADFALDFSKQFSRDPTEIAQAMFENVKAGVGKGIEEITRYQIAVATATDEHLGGEGGVAQKLLGIMNAMDLSVNEFGRVSNATTAAANASMASVYSIGESMQYAAFTAHNFNIPLEQTLALIAKLSQARIYGSSAGTGINNMLTQLSKTLGPFATKQSKEAWKMLGLDMNQMSAMASGGDVFGIIQAVEKQTSGMSSVNRKGILSKLFNMRGDRAMEGLFSSKQGNKTLPQFLAEIQRGVKEDISIKQSKAMMNDLYSDFKFFSNALHRFRVSFMKAAEPTLRVLFGVMTRVVGWISSIVESPIGKILGGIAVVAAPAIGIIFAFRAAVFTATMALRTLAMTAGVGGRGALLGAGLNMIGMGRFGAAGGAFTRNAAGRLMVKAGETISHGGILYRGGQLLPKSFLASFSGSAATGFFARGTGLLGSIVTGVGRLIPIAGGILLGIEVLKMLGLNFEAKQSERRNDPLINEYYRNLDEYYLGKGMSDSYYNRMNKPGYQKGETNLNQQININIPGMASFTQDINQKLAEDQLNSAMDFNIK